MPSRCSTATWKSLGQEPGSSLLLNHPPWSDLFDLFDTTVIMVVPEAILRERLVARWQGYGLSSSEIADKVDDNDLPNGHLVAARSTNAEFVFSSGQ